MHEPVVDRTRKPRYTFTALSGFIIVHLAALGVFALGFSWLGVFLCIGSYYLRMFALTAGYHRYFSHRTFQLNRFWQFLLALLGQTAAQKGALWWAAHHRHHHRFSDQPEDLHSPLQGGFIWSHLGWILVDDYRETEYDQIRDMTKFPELVWLNKNPYLPTVAYAIALYFAFGWIGLFYGYFLSTVLLWHGTFAINSIMYVFGKRVYRTSDDSRNSMIFALVTMGEGWHNNHHYYPGSAAQGFRWWQIDMSYYILLLGEKLGIVKNLRRVPERVVAAGYAKGSATGFDPFHERLERLSQQWAEARASASVLRNQAVAELESARLRTAERLNQLEADYRRARRRAGLLAEARIDELRADIERLYQQLSEILERLLETVGSDAAAQPA